MATEPDRAFFEAQSSRILDDNRATRHRIADLDTKMSESLLRLSHALSGLDNRISMVKEALEGMIKKEIGGRLDLYRATADRTRR